MTCDDVKVIWKHSAHIYDPQGDVHQKVSDIYFYKSDLFQYDLQVQNKKEV